MLVTGAAGFLGSHLCDVLLDAGHRIIAVDDLSTGSLKNIEHLEKEPAFEFISLDICTPFDVGAVDFVFNLASPASPIDYAIRGLETLRVGSAGTLNTLEVAKKYSAGFLMASTSECYGDPLEHPQKETYFGNVNPLGPRSVYDEAKRFAEAATMAFRRYHDVDTRIVRIFNTYGPRMRPNDGRVIPNFMIQALRGEDLTVCGDGSQTRSFCFVSDQIRGIVSLSSVVEPLPVNIGNPQEFTVKECADAVLKVTGSKSNVRYVPLPQDDPKRRCPDISKARKLLHWEPRVDLEEGLRCSLPYFKSVASLPTRTAMTQQGGMV